jgi:hypothetical protein
MYDPFHGMFHPGDEPPPDPNDHPELLRLSDVDHPRGQQVQPFFRAVLPGLPDRP